MYFNDLDGEKKPAEESMNEPTPEVMEHDTHEPTPEVMENTVIKESAGGDRLRQLKKRVDALLQDSREMGFTEYLRQMRERIANQERQVKLLEEELDRRVQMYENYMQVQSTAQTNVQAMRRETAAPTPQAVMPQAAVPPVRVSSQMTAQSVPGPARSKRNAEFTIGAAVLGIMGSTFILTAMVLLGIHFLEGLMKGLLLYAVCVIVMLLGELLLYRRWPKLGMTFSAIGMGGLYISTLINYLVLGNFNQWVALGITLFITLVVVLLSRKRDAVFYRILGMVAMYVCILVMPEGLRDDGGLTQAELVTITVMAFIINVMCLIVPIRKAHTGVHVTHMALNTGFTIWAYLFWIDGSERTFEHVGEMWQYPFFVAMSVLVMQLIFVAQIRWRERQNPNGTMADNVGICIAYGFSGLLYMLLVSQTTDFTNLIVAGGGAEDPYLIYRLVCTAVAILCCLIPLLTLRRRPEKWFAWYLLNLVVIAIHTGGMGDWEFKICLLILLAASKLLSFKRDPMLRNSDAVITALACLNVLLDSHLVNTVPLFVALLLSVLCINYWNVYFETILTFTIAEYVSEHMLSSLKLPVFVGILFVGLLLFNNVKKWHGKEMRVYNALMLTGQGICYFQLINPVYRNAYLTYLCMLVFGVATIVICFQERYHLDFKGKQLVLAVFLTYMGLVVRTSYPIINSILLMLTALFCVGMGFVVNRKSVRIYGLVLSLVICGKLVLYDFMEAGVLQKTILFFAVGVLALIIAAIYMILERKQEKRIGNYEDLTGGES